MSSTERLPRTLTLMPTYACTASCRHCGTLSHPNARHRLDLDTVLVAIREAHELGFANVVFTGGEATLEWPNLLEGISCAHALRMPVRLVTNAHWATSPEVAAGRLAELRDAGLSEINFSTGDEHARFVPVDAVVTASLASVRLGFAPFIMVELREERRVTKSVVLALLQASSQGQDELARIRIEESPWMPLSPSKVAQYPEGVAVDSKNLARQRGCDNVLQTFVVQADGRIGACCGLGMRLIPELQVEHAVGVGFLARAIERAGNDFLKLWIHHQGPERILAWAAERDPTITWEGQYGHKCQACIRLYRDDKVRRVIAEHFQEALPTVIQEKWLDEQELPSLLDDGAPTATRSGDGARCVPCR